MLKSIYRPIKLLNKCKTGISINTDKAHDVFFIVDFNQSYQYDLSLLLFKSHKRRIALQIIYSSL